MLNNPKVFSMALLAGFASASFAQSYDPKKDPAYDGYKYRPGQGYSVGKFRLTPRPSCVREVKGTINVNGTFDGDGCLYTFKGTWKGKSYKQVCFAPKEISEGMPPIFKLSNGARLKNLQIECALDGVHTTKNNVIENVIFRDVEEDAITINENVTVKNSEFWFCNDKCIQMNKAKSSTVTGNRFYYAATAVLANWGFNISVNGNSFYNAKKAIRSVTGNSLVRTQGNTAEGGSCFLGAESKGQLEDLGGNIAKGVKARECISGGGRIIRK